MVSEAWLAACDSEFAGIAETAEDEIAEAAPAEPPGYEEPPSYMPRHGNPGGNPWR